MNFLYFVPDRGTVSLEVANEIGVGYAFERSPTSRACAGPNGAHGVVFSCCEPQHVRYESDRQDWRTLPKNPAGVYVGYWSDHKPTPDCLQREIMISGEVLRLNDGHDWLMPKARLFDESLAWAPNLPTVLDFNDDGTMIYGDIQPKYRELWELAIQYDDAYVNAWAEDGKGTSQIEAIDVVGLASMAVAVNYRVSKIELAMLGVLDTKMWSAVLDILLDRKTQYDLLKKKLTAEKAASTEDGNTTPGSSGQELRIAAS